MQAVDVNTRRLLVPWCHHTQAVGVTTRRLLMSPHADCWCPGVTTRRLLVSPHADCWCRHTQTVGVITHRLFVRCERMSSMQLKRARGTWTKRYSYRGGRDFCSCTYPACFCFLSLPQRLGSLVSPGVGLKITS